LRERYLSEGLGYLPKLLELVDKNRLSRTYGCFDRSFWHYRTSDFPSGMYQEAVLPLAIVYGLDIPRNPYFRQDRIREIVAAGIDFARRSSHKDGSCDDYFPFERASGATAFSLYACTEACLLLNLDSPHFLEFFRKRGSYLANHGYEESGILSNHKALIALALYNVYLTTGDPFFKEQASAKLETLLSLQKSEGWFPEYEGCDPGYLTFTIDFLAKYFQKSKDPRLLNPLTRAMEFASYFMHPDGSFGGEYGSRNTFHFMPHGFELMAPHVAVAAPTANLFLEGIRKGKRSYIEDDRIFIHYVYNFLQAYRDFYPGRQLEKIRNGENFLKSFKEAGFVVKSSKHHYVVISAAKGGVAKVFKNDALQFSDCGIVGITTDGRQFISQVQGLFLSNLQDGQLTIEGVCYEHRDLVFSPFLFVLFRIFMLVVGRFFSANIIRGILQKKGILKKHRKFPLRFKKQMDLESLDSFEYSFHLEDRKIRIKELWIASDSTFIYVATSQPYQQGNLKLWVDLSSVLPALHEQGTASFRFNIS
jgi:hypothetical protein